MGVAGEDRIIVFTSNFQERFAQFQEQFAKREVVVARIHAKHRCAQVVAGAGGVLLAADFQANHLDETAFKRRVQVFDAGVFLEVRSNRISFDFTRSFQNRLTRFFADNALLFEHQDVCAVNRQIGEVRRFIVAFSNRVVNVLDDFRGDRFADTAAIIVFRHLTPLLRT